MLNILKAFLKRDFIERTSYKSSFLFEVLGIFSNLITFYFIQKLFIHEHPKQLLPFGGEYFPFVLIGLAFSSFQSTALNSFSTSLRQEQMQGTLEAILLTPTKIETVMLAGSFWNFTLTTLKAIGYLILGSIFFNLDLSHINFTSAFVSLSLTILCLSSLGLFSAGYVLVHQKGDPVNFLINSTSRFFAGVYFPIAMLPNPIQWISKLIPLTYSLNAMRYSILGGRSIYEIHSELFALGLSTIILLPTAIFYFKHSVQKAKREGTLIFY